MGNQLLVRLGALAVVGVAFASPRAAQDDGDTRGDLARKLYRAALAAAEAKLALHETDLAQMWLAEAPHEHRGWEWRHLAGRADQSAWSVELDGTITEVAASPDGAHLAATMGDGSVYLLDPASGKTRRHLTGHERSAWSPSFSNDGTRLVTASSDGTARVWEVATGEPLLVLRDNGQGVAGTAWSPDDSELVVTSWDLRGGASVRVYGTIHVWDVESGTLLHDVEHGDKPLASAAWSPDGNAVAVGSWDSEVAVFHTDGWESPTLIYPERSEDYKAVRDVAFAPDGNLAVSYADGRVRLADLRVGRYTGVCSTARDDAVQAMHDVCFLDATRIATAGEDQTVRLWDVRDGRLLTVLHGHTRGVVSVAASGEMLFSAGGDRTVRAWDLGALDPARTTWRLSSPAYSIALSPDGTRAVSAAWAGWVRVHDVATGAELLAWEGHGGSGVGAAWSPDGRHLATTGNDGRVVLWDAESGALIHELLDAEGQIESVAFRPDARQVASVEPAPRDALGVQVGQAAAVVFDTASGAVAARLEVEGVDARHVAWAPNGQRLAVACKNGDVRLWDLATGEAQVTIATGSGTPRAPVFSSDGAVLTTVTGSRVAFWDVASGDPLREFSPRVAAVNGIAFSPDGLRLAGALANNTLEVWDATDGGVLLRRTYGAAVWAVSWPTEDALYAVPIDDTIRVLRAR